MLNFLDILKRERMIFCDMFLFLDADRAILKIEILKLSKEETYHIVCSNITSKINSHIIER